MSNAPRYRRVLLKLSGEALMGGLSYGIDGRTVERIAADIVAVRRLAVDVGVVVGGGNIFRGLAGVAAGIERATADQMGMLATVINALALRSALERQGAESRVLSAIPMTTVCEPHVRQRALRHLEKGRVVIFAGGTGNPFFTTDTAAALRAAEIRAEVLFKGTQVDGVYSADPRLDSSAVRYAKLSFLEVLSRDLKVMDASAISLARENRIPVVVFSIHNDGGFAEVLTGGGRFTLIDEA